MHNPRFTIPAKHSGLKITLRMFCATTAANAATCAKYASTPMDKFMLSACPTTNAANCGTLSRRREDRRGGHRGYGARVDLVSSTILHDRRDPRHDGRPDWRRDGHR